MILSKYNSSYQGLIRGLGDLDLKGTRYTFANLENFESYALSTDNIGYILDKGKWLPDESEGVAALAQHYGLPTRLLD